MDLVKYGITVFFLVTALSLPAMAAPAACSFSKSLQKGGAGFDITSRPGDGCAVQIVTVIARRGGRPLATLKADVDYLARSAQIVDLAGDGSKQLAVTSRSAGKAATDVVDVYWLEGTTLRRSALPELDDKTGYRGGDRFQRDGSLFVRTFPVYRHDDPAGKPTGGTRILKYTFRDGVFALYVQTENPSDLQPQSTTLAEPATSVEDKPAVAAAPALAVTGVVAGETGIEIRSSGPVAKYRTIRLDKPERIAIDIPGADSSLAGKKIRINRFGISTVRVGRNKGFLRVVFDTPRSTFPNFDVKTSDNGVQVGFPE